MNSYAEKTDQQINALVAVANGLNVQERSIVGIGRIPVVVKLFRGVEDLTSVPDYCNNWADAGPVIEENNTWIQPDMIGDGLWHCYDREDEFHSKHANPLRAAMIVFLMIKDAGK